MNKRHGILIIVLGVIVGLGPSIVGIIFPAYEPITQAFVFLLIGISLISGGIYRLRKPKGGRIPWWKDFLLIRCTGILGLWLVFWGARTLAHTLILLLAYILFVAGLFIFLIYRIIKEIKDLSRR